MVSVLGALDRELKRLPVGARGSVLAAAARELAARLDDGETSATAAAGLAKELREHVAELRDLAGQDVSGTATAKLAAKASAKLKVVR